MENTSSSIELAYSSIPVFADDGTIDMEELNFLIGLALKDGQIDDEEKRLLGNIFAQVPPNELSPKVRARISEIKKKYDM